MARLAPESRWWLREIHQYIMGAPEAAQTEVRVHAPATPPQLAPQSAEEKVRLFRACDVARHLEEQVAMGLRGSRIVSSVITSLPRPTGGGSGSGQAV